MTVLSRDEFLLSIQTISLQETMAGVRELENHLSDHDQAQRAVIEQQAKKIAELKQQTVDYLKLSEMDKVVVSKVVLKHSKTAAETIKQQAKEVSVLKDAYSKEYQEHHRHCSEYSVKIAKLREALQLLYDCQNGCPLPKYEAEWNRAMALTRSIIEESV